MPRVSLVVMSPQNYEKKLHETVPNAIKIPISGLDVTLSIRNVPDAPLFHTGYFRGFEVVRMPWTKS